MHITRDNAGSTLVEALVAAGLLVTVATGTASLVLLGHRLGERSEQSMAATSLAAARLQSLLAIPWMHDLGGVAPEVPALGFAPGDVLDRDTSGYWEATDESGRPLAEAGAGPATYVMRWAVWPVTAGTTDARAIEVCVFPWPAAEGVPPLTCLASARVRQP